MGTASITITDSETGELAMTVQYIGLWDPESRAHRTIHDIANAIGEPTGEPVISAEDKASAEPKLIIAAG